MMNAVEPQDGSLLDAAWSVFISIGSEPCGTAGRQSCIDIKRNHLLAAHSDRHRVCRPQSHRAPTTREEAMTGTWLWPKLNSRRAIGSRPRTTTSTPNIISEC